MVKETRKIAVTSFKILYGKLQLLLSISCLAAIFLHIVYEVENKKISLTNFLHHFYSSQRNYIALKLLCLDQTLCMQLFFIIPSVLTGQLRFFFVKCNGLLILFSSLYPIGMHYMQCISCN